jgi:hypothetical protein
MWSLVVVNLAEGFDALRLLNQVEACSLRGFLPERQVNALITPIRFSPYSVTSPSRIGSRL